MKVRLKIFTSHRVSAFSSLREPPQILPLVFFAPVSNIPDPELSQLHSSYTDVRPSILFKTAATNIRASVLVVSNAAPRVYRVVRRVFCATGRNETRLRHKHNNSARALLSRWVNEISRKPRTRNCTRTMRLPVSRRAHYQQRHCFARIADLSATP